MPARVRRRSPQASDWSGRQPSRSTMARSEGSHGDVPPGAWKPARRLASKAVAPVERILAVEASSGVILLVAAAIALAWANSPWAASYQALWHAQVGIEIGPWSFRRDLHFVV